MILESIRLPAPTSKAPIGSGSDPAGGISGDGLVVGPDAAMVGSRSDEMLMIWIRDAQEAASHSHPCTTTRYDSGRGSLDRHPTYIVATFVAGATR